MLPVLWYIAERCSTDRRLQVERLRRHAPAGLLLTSVRYDNVRCALTSLHAIWATQRLLLYALHVNPGFGTVSATQCIIIINHNSLIQYKL